MMVTDPVEQSVTCALETGHNKNKFQFSCTISLPINFPYKFSFGQSKIEHEFRTPLLTCKALTWEKGISLLEDAEEAWSWAGKK